MLVSMHLLSVAYDLLPPLKYQPSDTTETPISTSHYEGRLAILSLWGSLVRSASAYQPIVVVL